MRRLALVAIAILSLAFIGAKPAPAGDISLVGSAAYHQTITYEWSWNGSAKGFYYPMIHTECFQPDNPFAYSPEGGVYGDLRRPYESPYSFVLADGSSVWVLSGGGAAHCHATLYLYPGMHEAPIIFLDRIEFEAAG